MGSRGGKAVASAINKGISKLLHQQRTNLRSENTRIAASAVAILLLILGAIFRFPILLPRWMYPQWHAERRRTALAAASTSPVTVLYLLHHV